MHTLLVNIHEMPPPYPVGLPISTPSDVKEDEAAGYPLQTAAAPAAGYHYPTDSKPVMQNLTAPQDCQAQVAHSSQQGYPLHTYPHVREFEVTLLHE